MVFQGRYHQSLFVGKLFGDNMSIILLISIGLGRYVFLQFVVGEEHDQEAMSSIHLDEVRQLTLHTHLIGKVGIENDQRALAQMLIERGSQSGEV